MGSVGVVPKCSPQDHDARRKLAKVSPEACERAAATFRALGDTARLQLLLLLSRGELCVTEIAAQLDDNLSAVSQRLKLLRSERIVKQRRSGKHIFYSLSDQHVAQLIANAMEHAAE